MAEIFIGELPKAEEITDDDFVVGTVNNEAVKIRCSKFLETAGTWDNILEKPFDTLDNESFTLTSYRDEYNQTKHRLGIDMQGYIQNLPITDSVKDTDYAVGVVNNKTVRILCSNFLGGGGGAGTWDKLKDKPFDVIDDEVFVTTEYQDEEDQTKFKLSVKSDLLVTDEIRQSVNDNTSYINKLTNKEEWTPDDYNPDILTWTMYRKPIQVQVKNCIADSSDETVICSDAYTYSLQMLYAIHGIARKIGLTINRLGKVGGDVNTGVDFSTLTTMMTTGTQSGITVTADNENERFNFTVDGLPELSINSDGEWCINGETTGQSAHGNSVTATAVETGIEIKKVRPNGDEEVVGILTNGSKGDKGDSVVAEETDAGVIIKNVTSAGIITDVATLTNGANGVSPTIAFVQEEGRITINVTDAGGTHTTTIDTNNITRAEFDELKDLIGTLNAALETRLGGGA